MIFQPTQHWQEKPVQWDVQGEQGWDGSFYGLGWVNFSSHPANLKCSKQSLKNIFRPCGWSRSLWEQHLHSGLVHSVHPIFWTPTARWVLVSNNQNSKTEPPSSYLPLFIPNPFQVRGLQDLTARLMTLTPFCASRWSWFLIGCNQQLCWISGCHPLLPMHQLLWWKYQEQGTSYITLFA